jgi:hypothetical protein
MYTQGKPKREKPVSFREIRGGVGEGKKCRERVKKNGLGGDSVRYVDVQTRGL